MFRLCECGDWTEGRVLVRFVQTSRRILPAVEAWIDAAWRRESARLGQKLFDGPMCRLEACAASPDALVLALSRTSYRPFLGTHLAPPAGEPLPPDARANPVGMSSILQSADGWLLLGRRNDSVAYYPNRIHPFAGALEPPAGGQALDVFDEIRRELREELRLSPADIASLRCIGMVEDLSLGQPELVFHALSTRTRHEIEATLERDEHHAVHAVAATPAEAQRAIDDPALTPVAVASLSLWSRVDCV